MANIQDEEIFPEIPEDGEQVYCSDTAKAYFGSGSLCLFASAISFCVPQIPAWVMGAECVSALSLLAKGAFKLREDASQVMPLPPEQNNHQSVEIEERDVIILDHPNGHLNMAVRYGLQIHQHMEQRR